MVQTSGFRRAICFVLFVSAVCFATAAYSAESGPDSSIDSDLQEIQALELKVLGRTTPAEESAPARVPAPPARKSFRLPYQAAFDSGRTPQSEPAVGNPGQIDHPLPRFQLLQRSFNSSSPGALSP